MQSKFTLKCRIMDKRGQFDIRKKDQIIQTRQAKWLVQSLRGLQHWALATRWLRGFSCHAGQLVNTFWSAVQAHSFFAWLWWDDLTQNRVCNICCSEVWDLAMVHSTFCPVFAASKTRSRLEIRSWKIAWLRLEAFEKSLSRRNFRIIMECHGLSDYPVGGWFVTFAWLPNKHKWAVEITTIGELVQPHHELIWTFWAKSMVPKRHENEGEKKIQKND